MALPIQATASNWRGMHFMKIKFTKSTAIAELPADQEFLWDEAQPGFGLRNRGGKRTWIVQARFNGATRRQSLGDVRRVDMERAKAAAREFTAKAILGTDPVAERALAKARAKRTLGSVVEKYIAARTPVWRPNSIRHNDRYLRRYFASLHNTPIDSVERADVADVIQDIAKEHGAVTADRAKKSLSACFAWAMRQGQATQNPVANMDSPSEGTETPRDRVLTSEEVRAIWNTLPSSNDFGRSMRLLFWTACRRAEIGGLKWSEIDFDKRLLKIPGSRMKGKKEHQLPLVEPAIELLRSIPRRENNPFVFGSARKGFTSWSQPLDYFREHLEKMGHVTEPWAPHDIRRTIKTGMSDLSIDPWVSERVLAHGRHGIESTYDWSKLLGPMRIALEAWARRLDEIVSDKTPESNVVTLRA
jgi:integrase